MEALSKRHEEEMAPLIARKVAMEKWLLARLNDTGQKSAKTDFGTASKVMKSSYTVADWSQFWEFVKERPDVAQFLPSRVNATAVQEFIDQTGTAPPGVGVSSIIAIQVRKS